jgi:hypothetical protein
VTVECPDTFEITNYCNTKQLNVCRKYDYRRLPLQCRCRCRCMRQKHCFGKIPLPFAEGALWRDILALTWDFRTFQGPAIQQFLVANCLAEAQMSKLELKGEHLRLIRPYPDIVWIEAMFTRIRLRTACLPISEDLKDFPEKVHSDTTDRRSYSNTL